MLMVDQRGYYALLAEVKHGQKYARMLPIDFPLSVRNVKQKQKWILFRFKFPKARNAYFRCNGPSAQRGAARIFENHRQTSSSKTRMVPPQTMPSLTATSLVMSIFTTQEAPVPMIFLALTIMAAPPAESACSPGERLWYRSDRLRLW